MAFQMTVRSTIGGAALIVVGVGWYLFGRLLSGRRVRRMANARWLIDRYLVRRLRRGTITKDEWIRSAEVAISRSIRGWQPWASIFIVLLGMYVLIAG